MISSQRAGFLLTCIRWKCFKSATMKFISDDIDGAATSIFLSHRSKDAGVRLQQSENGWQRSALTVIPSMGG